MEPKRPWRKLWVRHFRTIWLDAASVGLDSTAMLVRIFLLQHVGDVESDGTGWATTGVPGQACTPAWIARLCRTNEAEVLGALDKLVAAGAVVRHADGRIGTPGWSTLTGTEIEGGVSPSAQRMRRHRERRAQQGAA